MSAVLLTKIMKMNKTNKTNKTNKKSNARNKQLCRILIVDDHPAVREGLAARIATVPDMEICGAAEDAAEAMQLVRNTHPDIAIVDISLKGGCSGLDLIKRIKDEDSSLQILVWSMHPDSLYAERSLRAGALGYINKTHTTSHLLDAIQKVRNNQIYLSEDTTKRLLQHMVGHAENKTSNTPCEVLSNRELEVFILIGEGLSTKRIAKRLNISVHTVETHRLRIKCKLDIKSATELTNMATRWLMEHQ